MHIMFVLDTDSQNHHKSENLPVTLKIALPFLKIYGFLAFVTYCCIFFSIFKVKNEHLFIKLRENQAFYKGKLYFHEILGLIF